MAGVCQRLVVIRRESELAYPVGTCGGVDPEKQVVICADADCKLIFGGARQRRVNDVNMPNIHGTPYAANSAASWMI
jgi:hypothetical protein